MSWREQELSEIDGSINVRNENAQSQVTKGTVRGGHLGVVQGYLVYKFITVNVENQTGYITLIDAETAMNFTPSGSIN